MEKDTSKIIIHNQTDLPDFIVLQYINKVVQKGKISETKKGKQYCFATIYESGYTVISSKNKTNTYTFWIYKDKK